MANGLGFYNIQTSNTIQLLFIGLLFMQFECLVTVYLQKARQKVYPKHIMWMFKIKEKLTLLIIFFNFPKINNYGVFI